MKIKKTKKGVLTGLAILMSAAVPVSAATVAGDVPTGWIAVGNAGSGDADGDVLSAPTANGNYTYVSSASGISDVGALDGVGGDGKPIDGSTLTTAAFSVDVGDALEFFFNYVTSDGAGYSDYAWARVLDSNDAQTALLFTARTTPGGSSVPGFEMPNPEATLIPASVDIQAEATNWSALGDNSGACFSAGCGSTGWVQSLYTFAEAGIYKLQFGVTNWNDSDYQSGLAIAGATIGGVSIDPVEPMPSPVPLPAAGWMLLASLGGMAALRRVKAA